MQICLSHSRKTICRYFMKKTKMYSLHRNKNEGKEKSMYYVCAFRYVMFIKRKYKRKNEKKESLMEKRKKIYLLSYFSSVLYFSFFHEYILYVFFFLSFCGKYKFEYNIHIENIFSMVNMNTE